MSKFFPVTQKIIKLWVFHSVSILKLMFPCCFTLILILWHIIELHFIDLFQDRRPNENFKCTKGSYLNTYIISYINSPKTQITFFIFATWCQRPLIWQTINSTKLRKQSLKYQRFTPPCLKDKIIRKLEFEATNNFVLFCFMVFPFILVRVNIGLTLYV